MTKTERRYHALLAEYGCRVLNQRSNRHLVLSCEAGDGRRFLLTVPSSPSDHRHDHRVRQDIRRALASQAR